MEQAWTNGRSTLLLCNTIFEICMKIFSQQELLASVQGNRVSGLNDVYTITHMHVQTHIHMCAHTDRKADYVYPCNIVNMFMPCSDYYHLDNIDATFSVFAVAICAPYNYACCLC